jgi:hypothetical protein
MSLDNFQKQTLLITYTVIHSVLCGPECRRLPKEHIKRKETAESRFVSTELSKHFQTWSYFFISTLGPKSFLPPQPLRHHSGYQVAVILHEGKFLGLDVCRLSTQLYLRTFLRTDLASAAFSRNIISARPNYQYKYITMEQTYERRYFVNACYLFSRHKVLSLLFLPFCTPNAKCYKTATLRKSDHDPTSLTIHSVNTSIANNSASQPSNWKSHLRRLERQGINI